MREDLKITIIRDYADFLRIEDEWNRLVENCADESFFLRHEWFSAMIDAFGFDKRLFIVCVREKGRLVGILPLCLPERPILGTNHLVSLTNSHTGRFSFIFEKGRERLLFFTLDLLFDKWGKDFIRADFVSEDSIVADILEKRFKKRLQTRYLMASPELPIEGSFSGYTKKNLSKSFRKKCRQRAKRAARSYDIEFEVIRGKDLRVEHLTKAFQIEDSGWKGRRGTSILKEKGAERFYRTIAMTFAQKDLLELSFLNFDKRPVAFELAVIYKGRLLPMKAGYEESYSEFSPGHLLTMHTLERAFDRGLCCYDFLGDKDAYKMRFTKKTNRLFCLYIFSRKAKARLIRFLLFDSKKILEDIGLKEPIGLFLKKNRLLRFLGRI